MSRCGSPYKKYKYYLNLYRICDIVLASYKVLFSYGQESALSIIFIILSFSFDYSSFPHLFRF